MSGAFLQPVNLTQYMIFIYLTLILSSLVEDLDFN